jgi:uncharacterized protein (DUF2147 family)
MKRILVGLLIMLSMSHALIAQDIVGFWKTINDKTDKPESIVGIYSYQGKYYGRLLATYNEKGQIEDSIYEPKDRAPGVVGNPYYSGLDIIWDLEKDADKYTNGKILDPKKGKIYEAEAWLKDGKLIVRGEILFFGVNQTWPAATDADFPQGFKKPDLKKMVPKIPVPN